jgi:cytochrome c oxidase assembly protein subunit 15
MMAYTLFILAVLHAVDAARSRVDRAAVDGALWLFGVVALQATLGILTLLNQAPMDLALAHQAVAIVVLTFVVAQVERLTGSRREAAKQETIGEPVTQPG